MTINMRHIHREFKNSLGESLTHLRDYHRMTNGQAGIILGMSQEFFCQVASGKKPLSFSAFMSALEFWPKLIEEVK